MKPTKTLLILAAATTTFALPRAGQADWNGLVDNSDALQTDTYGFSGSHPLQINGNENYYDGDLGDYDGDGVVDRALGSRYGLLMNTGGGLMTPYNGFTGFLIRGMPGASGWGEDAFQWADVDGDGDLDNLSGGNNEPLTLQINRGGQFSTAWQLSQSALNISNTDVDGDGDVDLFVAHSFCAQSNCGGPVNFALLINDGEGNFTDETSARGLDMSGSFVVGVVSGDLDGDGDYDALIQRGQAGGAVVQVAINDGTGNYTLTDTDVPTAGSGFGQGNALGDLDGDGDLDLVIARGSAGSGHPTVSHVIGLNDGSGGFSNVSASHWDAQASAGDLRAGNGALLDLDYDGDLDFVAFAIDNGQSPAGTHVMQVFLGDGTGVLTHSEEHSVDFVAGGAALGGDADIADLDNDGDYDVWLGVGGDRVRIMLNDYEADDGLPADVPRDLEVEDAAESGVTLRWSLPSFASNSTYYKVWRSTSPGLDDRDRELVAVIGQRHQDEAFADPITAMTDPSRLGPGVDIDAGTNTISFVDDTVVPGQTYQYSVSHVGAENSESRQAAEVFAVVPGGEERIDGSAPVVTIIGPTGQDWWSHPRVVAHFADSGAGVDPDSIRVSFDTDLGNISAGEDASGLAYRKDSGVIVIAAEPPNAFPANSLVTMTVQAADNNGNMASEEQTFFVTDAAAMNPTASLSTSGTAGAAPYTVDFDSTGSDDADGRVFRTEWYFGDGTTAVGRTVSHTFGSGGTFDVRLVVRDNEGGVAVQTVTIDVDGEPAACVLGEVGDCYEGPQGTEGVGICEAGAQQCGPSGWGECQGEVLPGSEVCDDGLDNDCDGDADDIDTDCGGPGGESSGSGGETDSDGGPGSESDGPGEGSAGSETGPGDTEGDTEGPGAAAEGGGCGCSQGPGGAGWVFGLWGLVMLRRRERSARI